MKRLLLCVAFAAMGGCAAIDTTNPPAADYPHLKVVEEVVSSHAELERKCHVASSLMVDYTLEGCAMPNFATGVCHIYYDSPIHAIATGNFLAMPYVQWHERMHCEGYDHPGENEIHQAWINYRLKVRK